MPDFGDRVELYCALSGVLLLWFSQSLDLFWIMAHRYYGCWVACNCGEWAEGEYTNPETHAPKRRALLAESLLFAGGWALELYVMIRRVLVLADIDDMSEVDLLNWAILSAAGVIVSLLLLALLPGGVNDLNEWKIPKVMIIFKYAMAWHWVARLAARGQPEHTFHVMAYVAGVVIPIGNLWVLLARYSTAPMYLATRITGGVLYLGGWTMLALCLSIKLK